MPIVTFYRGHSNPPKTTQGAHLGANVLLTCQGKLLLEKRRDCDLWGLVGGGVKPQETPLQAITREIWEELGLRADPKMLIKRKVYGEPGRIAAYQDGSIWRMVIVAYSCDLPCEPELRISAESKELRFFSREELKTVPVVVTHSDIVEEFFW